MKIDDVAILKSKGGDGPVLQEVAAKGRVSGMLFELKVTQRYRNDSSKNLEIVYTFPLAWGAVLLDLEFLVAGKKLTGVVVEKKAAERRYEDALADGDTPVMIERATDGLYTANVGNLLPGEEASITYRYVQALRIEHGQLRLTVPTAIAPRFGHARDSGMQPHQASSQSLLVEYPFAIEVDINASLPTSQITSPSHRIQVKREDSKATVHLAQKAYLDRDFVLVIAVLSATSSARLAADGEGYVAMASFSPISDAGIDAERPRALKIVIDCSGSMKGDSHDVAKRAVHAILLGLHAHDCFSITRFGNDQQHLFREMQPAQGRYLAEAKELLGSMQADMGGTEMGKALKAVYRLKGPSEGADILLITDGEIQAVDALVKDARAQGQRVFAVGVGSAPAESLLRRLAEATGGACEFVAPGDQIQPAAARMIQRMQSPCTKAVRVEWPSHPLWTASIPEAIYAGDTIHSFAGFKTPPQGRVMLSYVPSDSAVEKTVEAAIPSETDSGDALCRIAAAERLKEDLSREQMLDIAVRYQLVTSQTNFIAVYERAAGEKAKDLPELAAQAQMLAAGWGGTGAVADLGVAYAALSLDAPAVASHGYKTRGQEVKGDLGILSRVHRPPRPYNQDLSPEDFVAGLGWLFVEAESRLPRTINELRRLGLPGQVIEQLERLKALGIKESVVVAVFLEILLTSSPVADLAGRHAGRASRQLEKPEGTPPALFERMAHVMSHCRPHHWPEHAAWRSAFGG